MDTYIKESSFTAILRLEGIKGAFECTNDNVQHNTSPTVIPVFYFLKRDLSGNPTYEITFKKRLSDGTAIWTYLTCTMFFVYLPQGGQREIPLYVRPQTSGVNTGNRSQLGDSWKRNWRIAKADAAAPWGYADLEITELKPSLNKPCYLLKSGYGVCGLMDRKKNGDDTTANLCCTGNDQYEIFAKQHNLSWDIESPALIQLEILEIGIPDPLQQ
ncbi:hypothetical protein [Pseudomonas viridiflava]|uniref:hypothetical protein n=1 Tax=Pseudomonas viridiflava TaxID=33069 RepID=UPI001267D42E|nr:hypothetical protein [Pseudomonas viridiflava]